MSGSLSAPVPPRLPSLQLRGLRPEQMLAEVERWAADLIRTVEASLGESAAQKLGSAYAEMQGSLVLAGDAAGDLEAVPLRMLRSAEQAAQQQIAAVDTAKVAKAGDTMSGNLAILRTGVAAVLTLDTSDVRQRRIDFKTGGALRWQVMADNVAESGGNAGSNFSMFAYDDAGAGLGGVVSITRATRKANFPVVPSTSQAPSAVNDLTRKDYVDAQRDTRVAKSGDTMTGPLEATSISATGADPNFSLVRSGVRTWTHFVDGAGTWRLYDVSAGASRLAVDVAGNVFADVSLHSAYVRSYGQVRALGGVAFADSGVWGNRFAFGWDSIGGDMGVRIAVNGAGAGLLTRSPNIVLLTSMSDGTGPYLEYRDSSGNAFGARAFASDERLKENIEPVNDAFLPLIRAIKPRSFDWRQKGPNGETLHNPLGLVAQEVRAAIPSAARVMGDDPDGTLHLDPIALIAALIGAVTELAASNEAQSQTIEALRLRLGATDGEVTKLTVVDRLIERGSIHAALAALDSDPVMRARWDAAISVRVDDPLVVGLLTAIGEDPAVILAPMALA